MEKCAQSLSVFLVFALGIWTICYVPLVSGSSCSLFGVLFWRNALSDYGYMFCVRFHGAVLGFVFDMSVGVQQQGFGQTVEKTVGSAVAPLIRGRCPRFAGRADSLVQVWRRQSYPTVAACRTCSWTRSLTCLCCVTAGAWSSVQKLRILRTCSSSTRCRRPCDFAVTCLAVGGATDSVHRLIWWTSQFAQRQWYVAAMRDPG